MSLQACGDAGGSIPSYFFIMFFPSMVRYAPASHSAVALGVAAALASFNVHSADAAQGETLEPIVVTATRIASPWQSAPVGATVITANQIARAGVGDANEAVRKLAGVASSSDLWGGRERTLDLRGYGATASSNMVVLVNGVRISENENVSARLSSIPLTVIERIEVVRGGASVLWGEGASAGVINVILKDKARAGMQGRVLASIESFNGREVAADGRWANEQWGIDASVKRVLNDGYRDNSAYAQGIGSVGVQWMRDGLHAQARIQQEAQNARMPGALSFAQFAANRRQTSSPNDWAKTEETRHIGNVGFERGDWAFDLDLGVRDRTSSYEFVSWGTPMTLSKSRQTQMTPRVVYDGRFVGLAHRTLVGADFQWWRFRKEGGLEYGVEDGSQTNAATFFQSDWSLPSRTRVVIGARQEHVSKRDSYPGSPWAAPLTYDRPDSLKAHELSISQTVADAWDVYGRISASYRLPNIDENRSTSASSALRPQRNRDTEIGVKWAQQGQSATVRWFKQNTVDEVAFDPINYVNTNLDPMRRRGIELEGHLRPLERLDLSATWQHLTARYVSGSNAGKEPVLVAPFSATLRLTYDVNDAQSVSIGMQYIGPMRFGDDSGNTCSKRIPSSRPIDATYRWSDSVWTVVLAGTNLTDQHGYSYAYSCSQGSLYPDAGRALKLSISRSF